jgi:hypothetical protein
MPSYRDRTPSFGGYAPRRGGSILDIIMASGDAQAEAALRSGEIWQNAIGNIGQNLSGALTEVGKQREDKRVAEAVSAAGSSRYPSATKPVTGSEYDVPDPGEDHVGSILNSLSPELRPRALKGIQDFNTAADVAEERRLKIAASRQKLEDDTKASRQADLDAMGIAAHHVLDMGFLDGPDGGLTAMMQAAGLAERRGIRINRQQLDEFAQGMEEAQRRGPEAVAMMAKTGKQVFEPLLKQMTLGMSPAARKALLEEKEEGVIIPEGGTLAGKRSGGVIAQGAPKRETRSLDEQAAEALARGDQATYQRLLKTKSDMAAAGRDPEAGTRERIWVIRNGKPLRVRESEYQPGDLPANTREQGRPVTSGDAGRLADFDTSLDDINALQQTVVGNKATGTAAKIGAMLPNAVTDITGWGTEAKQKQATIDRVKQVIGKALEGGVLRKEDEYKYEKILPTIGDTQEVVAAKLDGLWKAIQLRRQTQLESLADAGYDTTKYAARPERKRASPEGAGPKRITNDREYNALPSGTEFIDPEGRRRRKP